MSHFDTSALPTCTTGEIIYRGDKKSRKEKDGAGVKEARLVLAGIFVLWTPAPGSRCFRNSRYLRIVPVCIKTTLCELSAYVYVR